MSLGALSGSVLLGMVVDREAARFAHAAVFARSLFFCFMKALLCARRINHLVLKDAELDGNPVVILRNFENWSSMISVPPGGTLPSSAIGQLWRALLQALDTWPALVLGTQA